MKRKLLYTLLFSTVIIITGCAGGGGGGGGASNPGNAPPTQGSGPALSTTVPFSTPVHVATVAPLGPNVLDYAITSTYNVDLSGTGADNVVIASRESASNTSRTDWKNAHLSVLGWSGNTLVDQTAQWFAPGDNVVVGTEPSVKFGNFSGNGKNSMFVAPSTDGNIPVTQLQVFVNNGTNFTRKNIDLGYNLWSHDSATFRWNGYDNIVSLDYGPNGTFVFGTNTGNFRAYNVNNWAFGGSSIAAGNFTGNGETTFVVSDTGNLRNSTRLFSWSKVGETVSVNEIGILPTPRFELPMYDNILPVSNMDTTGNRSHNIRAMTFDFDNSGIDSVFIISRPSRVNGSWAIASEFQMLKNNGVGVFTDVTDTTVFGYDKSKGASYNPTIMDVNNDGLKDIVLPGALTNDTQVLLHTKEHKYVGAYANVINDFQAQVFSMQRAGYTGDGSTATVNFVKGPNGDLYLLDMIPDQTSTTGTKSFYLSKIGSTSVANARATITAIKQQWPWMSDAQVNTVLAATGKTWFGATIIDPDAAFNPVGALSLSTSRGLVPIQGYIAGLDGLGTGLVSAVDSTGRNFNINMGMTRVNNYSNSFNMNGQHIDQHEITGHTEYLINGSLNNVGPLRIGTEVLDPQSPYGARPKNYSVGIPRYWTSRDGKWSAGTQYTTLSYNPWMAFGGSWGQITQTGNLDHTVRYIDKGWSAVAGTTYTTTNMTPGLITSVAPIVGAWGEAGYRFTKDSAVGDLGLYAGVKPVILSSNIQANLPTGIDNDGNTVYTKKTLTIQNQTAGYIRALWTAKISKNSVYRVSGTTMTNGQYRLMNEIRFFLD